MSTLTDFLLARIAEDEAVAQAAMTVHQRRVKNLGDGRWGSEYFEPLPAETVRREVVCSIPEGMSSPGSSWGDVPGTAHFKRFDPACVLAECAAKRRIVELRLLDGGGEAGLALYQRIRDEVDPHDADDFTGGAVWALDHALRALASVYADHPGYRQEWRP